LYYPEYDTPATNNGFANNADVLVGCKKSQQLAPSRRFVVDNHCFDHCAAPKESARKGESITTLTITTPSPFEASNLWCAPYICSSLDRVS